MDGSPCVSQQNPCFYQNSLVTPLNHLVARYDLQPPVSQYSRASCPPLHTKAPGEDKLEEESTEAWSNVEGI